MAEKDDGPRPTARITRKRGCLIVLLLCFIAAAWGAYRMATWRYTGPGVLDPDAAPAERWDGTGPKPVDKDVPPEVPWKNSVEKEPGPTITYDKNPEVPEKIRRPSPPITDGPQPKDGSEDGPDA